MPPITYTPGVSPPRIASLVRLTLALLALLTVGSSCARRLDIDSALAPSAEDASIDTSSGDVDAGQWVIISDVDLNEPCTEGDEQVCESGCATGIAYCVAGEWLCDAPSECPCSTGSVRYRSCGTCGTTTRVCGLDGRWTTWSSCVECECAAGVTEVQPCGECGEQWRACSDAGTWEAWGTCEECECLPDSVDSQACGECGTQERTCTDAFEWGEWSACSECECMDVGGSETVGCGNCGEQSRECLDSLDWGEWSACAGEGCAPGETQSCSVCGGTGRQTCTSSCAWGSCQIECCSDSDCASGEGCWNNVCYGACPTLNDGSVTCSTLCGMCGGGPCRGSIRLSDNARLACDVPGPLQRCYCASL